jgi:DNA-binding XRE family transcriptional regulator
MDEFWRQTVVFRKCKTVAFETKEGLFELRSSSGKVVGYGFMDASERFSEIDFLDPLVRFAVQLKMVRLKKGLTQARLAKQLGIGLLPYQRLESGANNPTLKTILKLKSALPEISVDKIA